MKTSWHESFADRYAEWSAGRTADIPFYASLAREADGPVVELAIGNGRFAWDAFAFDHHTAVRLDGSHQQEPGPHTTRYSVGDNRIDLTPDGGGTSSMWWATKNEWLGLIDVAGLEVEALYGGFAGEPFTGERTEYVFVARHRRADD